MVKVKYLISENVIREFLDVCKRNSINGPLETLAFLLGYKIGNELVSTELVFPRQVGTQSKVEDKGTF